MAQGDRGESRSIYVALIHGPSFLALSKWARALFYPVKLRLGPLGISPVPGAVGVFSELTGMTFEEVQSARDELHATNWVRTESTVWWLIRGLEFEPGLDVKNVNHRIFVQREWLKLPNLKIRAEFAANYTPWMDGIGDGMESGNGNGVRNPIAITQTQTQTKASSTTAREAWLNKFSDPDRATVSDFLVNLPGNQTYTWSQRLQGYLEGMDMPAGKLATPAAIATTIRDLAGTELNPAKFRRYVERAINDAANPISPRLPALPSAKAGVSGKLSPAAKKLEADRASR